MADAPAITPAIDHSEAKPRRRWYQFSLRTALLLMFVISLLFAGFAWWRDRAERQRKIVAELRELGAEVDYKYFVFFERTTGVRPNDEFFVVSHLRNRFGNDFVSDVRSVRYTPSAYVPPRPVPPPEDGRRIVELVKQLPRLEDLRLHADVIPQDLAEFPFLETIKLFSLLQSRGTWTDADLAPFERCSKLEYFGLAQQPIDGSGLVHLHNSKNLRYLILWRTNVGDAALVHLPAMTSLEHLNLGRTKVSDAGVATAELPQSLQSLELDETAVGDAAMENISQLQLPNLIEVSVKRTQVTKEGIERFDRRHERKGGR
ncbi:MAG: hypothetical protein ACR2FY_14785 [Pirellulaceae bacterium]